MTSTAITKWAPQLSGAVGRTVGRTVGGGVPSIPGAGWLVTGLAATVFATAYVTGLMLLAVCMLVVAATLTVLAMAWITRRNQPNIPRVLPVEDDNPRPQAPRPDQVAAMTRVTVRVIERNGLRWRLDNEGIWALPLDPTSPDRILCWAHGDPVPGPGTVEGQLLLELAAPPRAWTVDRPSPRPGKVGAFEHLLARLGGRGDVVLTVEQGKRAGVAR